MEKKILWIILLFLALSIAWVHGLLSREFNPPKTVPEDTTNIEKRLNEIERAINEINQKHKILLEASEDRNEQLQTLLQWLGVVFIVLTVIFGAMGAMAGWRQSQQQGSLIGAHVRSAGNVSEVLTVVQNILQNRLLRVEEEKEEIAELKRKYETIDGLKKGIKLQRQRIESTAEEVAKTSRHDFKKPSNVQALNRFAQDFSDFRLQHPEEEEEKKFIGQCFYISGIAAVFNDQFKDIHNYLNQVITLENQKAEIDFASRKRLANAYYYLGLNHSNLGELDDATRFLEQAHKLDPEGTDLLTRLVMAEVYVMSGQDKKAEQSFQEINHGFDILKNKQNGRLWNHQLRMQSRAYLIQCNKTLIEKKGNWKEEAKRYAEQANEIEPEYYYASFTLGQVLQKFWDDKDKDKIRNLFNEAYSKIQESGHLHFVQEARIRILLLMVAAICGKHGGKIDDRVVNKYLDDARSLRVDLPKIDNRICTVFSPLSKQNVSLEIIGSHIEEIRKGSVLLL